LKYARKHVGEQKFPYRVEVIGSVLNSDWHIVQVIGQGSFHRVKDFLKDEDNVPLYKAKKGQSPLRQGKTLVIYQRETTCGAKGISPRYQSHGK
jgi:hypothetical protein